ncbi:hypothetical protein ACFY12_04515 [Streptomyces sp. NPDC001339]|uniref:hypothetical protein n=1 Tax=Streptomyces sp. NPDC001339 TaxID=3364563 RepID=UPI0036845740
MPSTVNDTKKSEFPTLPLWLTVIIGFAVAFILGEYYGFPWWLRFLAVGAVSLVMEAVNQAVRRVAHSRKND